MSPSQPLVVHEWWVHKLAIRHDPHEVHGNNRELTQVRGPRGVAEGPLTRRATRPVRFADPCAQIHDQHASHSSCRGTPRGPCPPNLRPIHAPLETRNQSHALLPDLFWRSTWLCPVLGRPLLPCPRIRKRYGQQSLPPTSLGGDLTRAGLPRVSRSQDLLGQPLVLLLPHLDPLSFPLSCAGRRGGPRRLGIRPIPPVRHFET